MKKFEQELRERVDAGEMPTWLTLQGWRNLTPWAAEKFPDCNIWYCERNGDPLACLAKKEVPREDLPTTACGYITFFSGKPYWQTPEDY